MCQCAAEHRTRNLGFDPGWLASGNQRIAHPDAPAGTGGPGLFRSAGTVSGEGERELLPHPSSPAARVIDPLRVDDAQELETAKAVRQPAPKVLTASSETIQGMTVKILTDLNKVAGLQGAITDFENKVTGKVSQTSDEAGVVKTVSNTIAWTLEIRTRYDSVGADGDSAYGRGTTAADIAAGNVTLGFHESCHRNDLVAYFKATTVPVFGGKVGQSGTEFQTEVDTYMTAWDTYFAGARTDTLTRTDEVGKPTKTQFEAGE